MPDLRLLFLKYNSNTLRNKFGNNSITLSTYNLPSHYHTINYNTSGDKGGIWGGGSMTAGNYGNPYSGNSTYANTAYAGGG